MISMIFLKKKFEFILINIKAKSKTDWK